LACHNYESAFMRFPPGCNWNDGSGDIQRDTQILSGGERMAWSVFILPYIEQAPLENVYKSATDDWSLPYESALNPTGELIASEVIQAYICPSDEGDTSNPAFTPIVSPTPVGKSNYVALAGAGDGSDDTLPNPNGGNDIRAGDMNSFNLPGFSRLWGTFAKNSKTGIGQISDGTSNTMIIGERATRLDVESGETGNGRWGEGAVWAGIANSNGDYPNDPRPASAGGTNGPVSKDWSVFGHMFSESPDNWSINGEDTPRGVASSFHTGGANGALGDGSVRFLSQDLNVEILADLVRISDGNVVSGF